MSASRESKYPLWLLVDGTVAVLTLALFMALEAASELARLARLQLFHRRDRAGITNERNPT